MTHDEKMFMISLPFAAFWIACLAIYVFRSLPL